MPGRERITVGVGGILEPLVTASELSDAMQIRDPFTSVIHEVPHPFGGEHPPRTSEEDARGLPAERILRITDEDGRSVETTNITVARETFMEDATPHDGAAPGGERTELREVWIVTFAAR